MKPVIIIAIAFVLLIPISTLAVSPPDENENQNVDLDLLFEKALESANNSKLNDAIFFLDEILKYDPDNVLALHNKGATLLKLEKYDEALSYFEKVIKINPDLIEAINGKAVALYNMNRDSDVLTMYYDAYKIDPFNLVTVKNMIAIADELEFIEKLDMITSYAKIEVRTFDDQLVGYTESHYVRFLHPLALMFLEDNAEWKPIEIDGEKFEVLEYSTSSKILKSDLSSYTKISLNKIDSFRIFVIIISYDGFLTTNGDKMSTTITLLRPVLDSKL